MLAIYTKKFEFNRNIFFGSFLSAYKYKTLLKIKKIVVDFFLKRVTIKIGGSEIWKT